MEDHSDQALENARALRRKMTLPEVLLWRILKTRPLGVKFRRQHPIGDSVADFYCAAVRTVVEIDGLAHGMGDRPQRDQRRDAWLTQQGIEVVRIPANDVLQDANGVVEALIALCAGAPPPSSLRDATSPNGGGSVW